MLNLQGALLSMYGITQQPTKALCFYSKAGGALQTAGHAHINSVPYLPHVTSPWVCFCAHTRLLCETQVPQQHSALSSPRGHKGPLVGNGSETVNTTHPCLQMQECDAQAAQTCLFTLLGAGWQRGVHASGTGRSCVQLA